MVEEPAISNKLSGIYVHIPYCKRKCHYCDFFISTNIKTKSSLVDALLKEINLRKSYLHEEVETIYFGGGTPSLLTGDELKQIVDKLAANFSLSNNLEFTLEANPEDLDNVKLKVLQQAGVNRLSIGVQSFFDDDLLYMNRAHTGAQAKAAVMRAQDAGITNISIDLIYALPDLDDAKWKHNLDAAIELQVPHISSYCLTVEDKTALGYSVRKGKSKPVNESKFASQFEILMDKLETANFEQYEISNFSKKGLESKHNSSYWKGKKYLGLGPSAHSFNGISRQWNVANMHAYLNALEKNNLVFEIETLNEKEKYNEWVLTRLRTSAGIAINEIAENFGNDFVTHLNEESKIYFESDALKWNQKNMVLTKRGKFIADKIASDLMML